MDETFSDTRLTLLLIATLALLVIGGVVDLVLDAPRSWLTPHVAFEVGLIAVGVGLALYLWRGWRGARGELARARGALADRAADRDAWRHRAGGLLADLRRAIDDQLDAWQLTPAEREVAVHLLQGWSHKEIAHRTGRSEPTVRQHAVAAYRKAGVAGRAELAAFFLGDLAAAAPPSADPTPDGA